MCYSEAAWNNMAEGIVMRRSILLVTGTLLLIANTGPATAVPQLLAAVPSSGPLDMVCNDNLCQAEFSAICLQSERSFPVKGTPYKIQLKDIAAVKLRGEMADGTMRDLSSRLLRIDSQRSHTAIRFVVDRSQLPQSGIERLTVAFDRLIALFPVPAQDQQVDHSSPQTADDLITAANGIRRAERLWLEFNADNVAVARIANRMSNSLPRSGAVVSEKADRLWRSAIAQEPGLSQKIKMDTLELVNRCQQRRDISLRHCLNYTHDQVMRDLNVRYWRLLKPSG